MREEYQVAELRSMAHAKNIRLLYWSHWNTAEGDSNRHVHTYWQLEFTLQGDPEFIIDDKSFRTAPGDIILIPPLNWHDFRYPENLPRESWSLKFEVNGMKEKLPFVRFSAGDESVTAQCAVMVLRELIRLRDHFHRKAPVIECLLSAMLEDAFSTADAFSGETKLLQQIRRAIAERQGGSLQVKDLARQLGYSKDHLSWLVKKETGLTLKNFLDIERMKAAERLLNYSGKTISEIADQLGFTDVYSFSHFFRRISGHNPSQYRDLAGRNHDHINMF